MKLLKKIYYSITFKAKILFLLYAVAAVPTFILLGFLYQYLVVSFYDKNMQTISREFLQQSTYINEKMQKAISISMEMNSNRILNNFFYLTPSNQASDVVEYNKMIDPVLSWLQITKPDEIGGLRFYTGNTNLLTNKYILPLGKYQKNDSKLNAAVKELDGKLLSIQYYGEERSFFGPSPASANSISVFTKMKGPPVYRTYMEAELKLDSIYKSLSASTNNFETANYLLIRSDGQPLFSSDSKLFEQLADGYGHSLNIETAEALRVKLDRVSYMINTAPIASIDCVLVSSVNLDEVEKPFENMRMLFILISTACIVILCVIANYLVNRLLQRLIVINDNIRRIQDGDYDIHINVTGSDAIDEVSNSLNTMASRIHELINDVYENQIQMKNLQIKMLTQQISPHFLYNTLECLKMRAELNDQRELAQGLTSLGKLLRYYSNIGTEISSVQKELGSITDYVCLMNLIHKNQCIMQIEADSDVLSLEMPNFVLQPLVENSIKHGGAGQHDVNIVIHIEIGNELLNFSVTDDGIGVIPERLAEIREQLELHNRAPREWEHDSDSIGIYNTNDRIKLVYGHSYGISIESEYKKGTEIKFSIPMPTCLP